MPIAGQSLSDDDVPVPTGAGASGTTLRVLLVEDDDGDALLVQEMLADTGASVDLRRVSTLSEALRSPVRADCVLLDLALPDAMGLDGLTKLRVHAPRTSVLVLTGQRDELTGMAAVGSGAQDYLVKDQIDGPLLVKALRYAWERKRMELVEQRLLHQELVARENLRLTRGLLPTPLLVDPGLTLATCYRPGNAGSLLGGDFYDAVELPGGQVMAVIGDVCGHGPDEAALGVALRIAWRSLVIGGIPMSEVLSTVERMLVHERIEPLFATVCMVELSADRRSLRLWLAGHPPPLLINGLVGTLLPSDRVGVPLGAIDGGHWAPVTVDLEPGWSLLLYTDGVFEGRVDGTLDRLGHEKMAELLLDILREHAEEPDALTTVIDELVSRVERLNGGPLDDDVAVALLSHTAGGNTR